MAKLWVEPNSFNTKDYERLKKFHGMTFSLPVLEELLNFSIPTVLQWAKCTSCFLLKEKIADDDLLIRSPYDF